MRRRLAAAHGLDVGRDDRGRAAQVGLRGGMRPQRSRADGTRTRASAGSGSVSNTSSTACVQAARVERREQILFHHVRAARQVHQTRARAHLREARAIEQAARVVGERQQVDDDVGRAQRRGQRRPAGAGRDAVDLLRPRAPAADAIAQRRQLQAPSCGPSGPARAPAPRPRRRASAAAGATASGAAARRSRTRAGAATARPRWPSRPSRGSSSDRPCARSARPTGSVASASSRSTPAHSDWISCSRVQPARRPGSGIGDDGDVGLAPARRLRAFDGGIDPVVVGQCVGERAPPVGALGAVEAGVERDLHAARRRVDAGAAARSPPSARGSPRGRRPAAGARCGCRPAARRRRPAGLPASRARASRPGPARPCRPAWPRCRRPGRRCR